MAEIHSEVGHCPVERPALLETYFSIIWCFVSKVSSLRTSDDSSTDTSTIVCHFWNILGKLWQVILLSALVSKLIC